ncbi:MAG: methyltransferase domain-containing protein [Lachnospiraceae bacterium]|nr:methyltransferase domain-containing protein [Lachnospiraceae bacterium]
MNIQWNPEEYTKNFGFVPNYGEDVLKLINAPPGSYVVDLGCGNGALTQKLQEMGYRVEGVDDSGDMILCAGKLHPDIKFTHANALTFRLEEKADVVFSNAVFHWIDEKNQRKLAENIFRNLKTGGILVCEFGGYGCAETVHSALQESFESHGLTYPRAFYFPTIGQYASILEGAGFRVEFAHLFDRPTMQNTADGAADWIRMFVKAPFSGMSADLKDEIIAEAVEKIRPKLLTGEGWMIDYVRIRVKAWRK